MKTLVIIPALNEEKSIPGVIEDLSKNRIDADILVIDDGSTDRTGDVARSLGVMVITLPFNLGIGAAMQTGYRYAERNGYDVAIQFDGDGQHRADQISELLRPVAEGNTDMVIGSRFLKKGSYEAETARFFGIKILSWIISLLSRSRITDPSSGFRAVNRSIIKYYSCRYPEDYPEPEAIILLHKAGYNVMEVPVLMEKRLIGTSSITLLRGIYYMIKVTLAIMVDMIRKV